MILKELSLKQIKQIFLEGKSPTLTKSQTFINPWTTTSHW